MLLIQPMAFYVFYIFILMLANFLTRKKAIKTGTVKAGYFKNLDAASFQPPEFIIRLGRHYDNQFQLPLLFFITCIVANQVHMMHPLIGILAWVYVATRIAHTFFHLGSNKIIPRMLSFGAGWICILAMWVLILLQANAARIL